MTETTHTVLVIEDDMDFLPLVRMMLDGMPGVRVATATTGAEGVAAARAQPPGVIILDLMLPDMHGFDALNLIREDPACRNIPVIVLSVMGTRNDRSRGMETPGVYAYLVKPCLPSQLRQTVAGALSV